MRRTDRCGSAAPTGARAGDKWHLDEVALKIRGKRHWLWRAVDQHGVVLDILVQERRDQVAAERFLHRVFDGEGGAEPRVVITDKLASYPPAIKRVLPTAEHRRHKREQREPEAARYHGNPTGFHRDLGAYISQRDLQQLFIRSIETEDIRDRAGIPFQVFYGISDNARQFWSIANAREVIGYAPEDDSEIKFAAGVAAILAPLGGPVPARPYPSRKNDPSDPGRPGRGP